MKTHNKLSGKIPSSIANTHSLFSLDLSYNNFTFNGMELIAQTFPDAIYSPQARIPIHKVLTLAFKISAIQRLPRCFLIKVFYRRLKTATQKTLTATAKLLHNFTAIQNH